MNLSKHVFSISNVYLLVWFAYHLQGCLFSLNSTLSQAFWGFQLLVSFYCLYYANKHFALPKYMKAVNLLVCLVTVYGILRVAGAEILIIKENDSAVATTDFLRHYYNSILPIYVSFVFTKTGQITERVIRFWVFPFIVFAMIEYYGTQSYLLATNTIQQEFTNNTGYVFLSILPAIFIGFRKLWIRYILTMFILLYVISSMKRGAILISIISLIYITISGLKNRGILFKFIALGCSILLFYGVYEYFQYMFENSEMFNLRMQETLEGNSSSRDKIAGVLSDYLINDATIWSLLFGIGADGTLKISWNFAHNDWLEIMVDMGLIGIIVYMYYWKVFFAEALKPSNDKKIKDALILACIYCFCRTFFSQSIDAMPIYLTYVLGYCVANNTKHETNKNITYYKST